MTGGASGIGRATALALASEGADVAIADLCPAPEVLAAVDAAGGRACGIVADVADEDAVVRMVEAAFVALGGLDLYVNNAGGAWHEAVTHVTRTGWERTIATNVGASVFACREVARRLIPAGGGAIVVIGSTATVSVQPRETSYRASKAALKAHLEAAAVELAPFGIRVNLVTPGATNTPFVVAADASQKARVAAEIPLRRAARPKKLPPPSSSSSPTNWRAISPAPSSSLTADFASAPFSTAATPRFGT